LAGWNLSLRVIGVDFVMSRNVRYRSNFGHTAHRLGVQVLIRKVSASRSPPKHGVNRVKRPQAKRMQLSQGKVGLAPVQRCNRHISRLGASCLCLCLREGDDAKATEVRSLAVYYDRQMVVLKRQGRMEWSFCVGWCAKTQKPRSRALAAKNDPKVHWPTS
jgi:hypothetical protein